jgi:hypothetical protein
VLNEIISFDLFDTLVARYVIDPVCVFCFAYSKQMGVDDVFSDSALKYAKNRRAAELSLARRFKGKQYNVDEIFEELLRLCPNYSSQIEGLKNAEYEAELELQTALVGSRLHFTSVLSQVGVGGIYVISDMYWASDKLGLYMANSGYPKLNEDRILSSANIGLTKYSGKIYKFLLNSNEFKSVSGVWTHYGDNLHSDVVQAKLYGIDAYHVDTSALGRELVCQKIGSTGWLANSIICGIGRVARLNSGIQVACPDAVFSVVSPVICAFVLWVMEDALMQQRKNIWFLARDGQCFLRVAKVFKQRIPKYYDLNLHYLPISRIALADILKKGVDSAGDELASIFGPQLLDASVFVDLGWGGTFARDLGAVFSAMTRPGVNAIFRYFGLFKPEDLRFVCHTCDFLHNYDLHFMAKNSRNIAVMEAFCAATHQKVFRLNFSENARLKSPLECSDDAASIKWGSLRQQLAYEAYANTLIDADFCQYFKSEKVISALLERLSSLLTSPTVVEAAYYGSYPHDVDSIGGRDGELSPIVSGFSFLKRDVRMRLNWYSGSIVRSRNFFFSIFSIKRFLSDWFAGLKSKFNI